MSGERLVVVNVFVKYTSKQADLKPGSVAPMPTPPTAQASEMGKRGDGPRAA